MNPLISVIVPVYGVEQYLNKCVESIVNQTYENLEIFLVDDGSPDNCPTMCDEWAKKDKRIRVIHQKNGGLSCARNTGIEQATGDYISFVDSDDWIALECYEKIMTVFQNQSCQMVIFNCNRINEMGEVFTVTEKVEKEGLLSQEQALKELVKGNLNNYAVNKVCKKELFSDVRFPVGRAWEDMATAYKLFLQCEKIYYLSEPFYFYYTRRNSISKKISDKALGDIFLARYEIHTTLKERYPSLEQYTLPMVALSARRLYDRSLWGDVDSERLTMAKQWLEENKETIVKESQDKKYRLYFAHPKWYNGLRKLRHKIGNLVKRVS